MDKKIRLTAVLVMLAAGTAAATPEGVPYARSTEPASNLDLVFETAPSWTVTRKPSAQEQYKSPKPAAQLKELDTPFRVVTVYEGTAAVKGVYKLNMPAGAHWRVLWKVELTEKKGRTAFHIELKSASDPTYLQGITKEMIPLDESAFGVINVCLTTGGEFTVALDIDPCNWKVEVQRLN